MINPYTERQKTLIVNNVVRACKDIFNLNKIGYNYLYQCNGFIAHYNMLGFIDHYAGRENSLIRDILQNTESNRWLNFRQGDENYDYYMSKAHIYHRIVSQLILGEKE